MASCGSPKSGASECPRSSSVGMGNVYRKACGVVFDKRSGIEVWGAHSSKTATSGAASVVLAHGSAGPASIGHDEWRVRRRSVQTNYLRRCIWSLRTHWTSCRAR